MCHHSEPPSSLQGALSSASTSQKHLHGGQPKAWPWRRTCWSGTKRSDPSGQLWCGQLEEQDSRGGGWDKEWPMGVLFHNEVTHPEMPWLKTAGKDPGFPGSGRVMGKADLHGQSPGHEKLWVSCLGRVHVPGAFSGTCNLLFIPLPWVSFTPSQGDFLHGLGLVAALETCCKGEPHKGGAGWQRLCCSWGSNPENLKRRFKGREVQAFLHPLALNQARKQRGYKCVGHNSFGHFPGLWVLWHSGTAHGSARQGSASQRWGRRREIVPP